MTGSFFFLYCFGLMCVLGGGGGVKNVLVPLCALRFWLFSERGWCMDTEPVGVILVDLDLFFSVRW